MPEDLDIPDEEHPDGPRQLREALKRAEDRAAAAEQRATALERETAFQAAGVDPTNPLHAAAMKGYDGDVSGIKEWVAQLGLTAAQEPAPIPDQERERLERIFNATAGDQGGQAPNPTADKDDELRAATAQATREGWTTTRYQDEMRRIMQKHGQPVATLPYEVIK